MSSSHKLIWSSGTLKNPRNLSEPDGVALSLLCVLKVLTYDPLRPPVPPDCFRVQVKDAMHNLLASYLTSLLRLLGEEKESHEEESHSDNRSSESHSDIRVHLVVSYLLQALPAFPLPASPPLPSLLYRLSLLPLQKVSTSTTTSVLPSILESMHNPSFFLGTSQPPGSNQELPDLNNLYVVVLPEGAVVRSGQDIDESPRIAVLPKGAVVHVEKSVMMNGIRRLKVVMHDLSGVKSSSNPTGIGGKHAQLNGWISERLRGDGHKVVVERVSRALSESVASSYASRGGGVIRGSKDTDLDDQGKKKNCNATHPIPHMFHRHSLRYALPVDMFPKSCNWEVRA